MAVPLMGVDAMKVLDRLFRRAEQAHPTAMTTSSPVADLSRYRSVADRIVVVDTETTGVYNNDRIVEVATVTVDFDGHVIDEWDSLINPGSDVGPTWIHGVTAAMVADAPSFADIADQLAARLHGAIVCAHNLPFDARMLRLEYQRNDIDVTLTSGLDTLSVTRVRLGVACQAAGITLDGPHQALTDARATTALMVRHAGAFGAATAAVFHGPVPPGQGTRRRRNHRDPARMAPPTFLATLASRVTHTIDDAVMASYFDVLDRAMADLHLDEVETTELAALAGDLGLSPADARFAHRRWVDDLMLEACADGDVDDAEYDQLIRAAHALQVDPKHINDRTLKHRTAPLAVGLSTGLGVCFTGEATDVHGDPIPRQRLVAHAHRIGLRAEESFTKSRCQLLVAADPATMSGKAAKARTWGVPIVSAAEFLDAADGAQLTGEVVVVAVREAATCDHCGTTFTQAKGDRRAVVRCEACRQLSVAPMDVVRAPTVAQAEDLTCGSCGVVWTRERVRGRKPTRCATCR